MVGVTRTGVTSQADQELIDYAAGRERTVTGRQIERWRSRGLLPPNVQRALGRGRGSTSQLAPGARELVVWLTEHARPGQRPADLALLAFGAGLLVPEATVRTAFKDAVGRIELSVERVMPAGSLPEDIADAAVRAAPRATMVPARIRRIDSALAKLGTNWSAPELTALDPGCSSEPATINDWTHAAVQMVLGGGGAIDLATIGMLARAMGPAGSASPVAAQMEYRWPGNEEEAEDLLTEDGAMSFLPPGDLRDHLRELAAGTPVEELRDAWRLTVHAPDWAANLCDAVEREIADRQAGEAMNEWVLGALGPPRLALITALGSPRAGPAGTATSALSLLYTRNIIRLLRRIMPNGQFDLLANPVLTPPFLVPFMTG